MDSIDSIWERMKQKEMLLKAMRELRENGYEDAFIRKIKKYKEL